jgi:hypothetical protein
VASSSISNLPSLSIVLRIKSTVLILLVLSASVTPWEARYKKLLADWSISDNAIDA